MLSLPRESSIPGVQSLVGELRSHKLQSTGKKKKKNPQNFKGKARGWDVHRRLWKALTNSWGGDRDDDSTCVGSAHAQKRSDKTVSSDRWLTLRLWASMKWRLKQNCELPSWVLKTGPNTYKAPQQRLEALLVLGIQGNFCLIISWPLANEAETSVDTHDKEYRLERTENH